MKGTVRAYLDNIVASIEDTGRPPRFQHSGTVTAADGSPWSFATEGHLVVALAGDCGLPAADVTVGAAKIALDLIALQPPALQETQVAFRELAAMREWCALPAADPTCRRCAGTGRVKCASCSGTMETECVCSCDDVHTRPCEDCREGKSACERCDPKGEGNKLQRPGVIVGVPFDRLLLSTVLGAAPDTGVTALAGNGDRLMIAAPGFRAVVMGMKLEPAEIVKLPVFAVQGRPELFASSEVHMESAPAPEASR